MRFFNTHLAVINTSFLYVQRVHLYPFCSGMFGDIDGDFRLVFSLSQVRAYKIFLIVLEGGILGRCPSLPQHGILIENFVVHGKKQKRWDGKIRPTGVKNLFGFPISIRGLTNETGTLDTLNEVSLAEEVENKEGRDNHQATGVLYHGGPKTRTSVLEIKL